MLVEKGREQVKKVGFQLKQSNGSFSTCFIPVKTQGCSVVNKNASTSNKSLSTFHGSLDVGTINRNIR
jgi:hypothetical protein